MQRCDLTHKVQNEEIIYVLNKFWVIRQDGKGQSDVQTGLNTWYLLLTAERLTLIAIHQYVVRHLKRVKT